MSQNYNNPNNLYGITKYSCEAKRNFLSDHHYMKRSSKRVQARNVGKVLQNHVTQLINKNNLQIFGFL